MKVRDDNFFKRILLNGNYVAEEVLKKAELFAQERHVPLTDYLYSHEYITKQLLGQAIAEDMKLGYADLRSRQPSKEDVMRIPENLAKKHRVVFVSEEGKLVTVASDDPEDENLIKALKSVFKGKKIEIQYTLPEDIEAAFVHYQTSLDTRLAAIIKAGQHVAPEILATVFADALLLHASDVHFEPQGAEALVRFRIDGALREVGRISKELYENLLNRVKVQGRMRTDEHFAAQDGALRFDKDGGSVDMRASLVPTIEGEKIVLRLLTSYVQGSSLGDLGLLPAAQESLSRAARKPFGMILVVGPTGSGKTTTLYSLLKTIHRPEVNITTIEDPVEYKVKGVNQIQVNNLTGLTFAKGLRSIVRQDPDVILVGEIRDKETAEIAVNAALTGHILLSTFHSNDAATAVPRLFDMGIEAFLLASTLNTVMAQRLARKICDHCKYSVNKNRDEVRLKNIDKFLGKGKLTLYVGKGCSACQNTGYRGRTALVEIIEITEEMKELMLKSPSSQQVWTLAKKQGSESMFEDGIKKVKNGVITLDELLRVAEPKDG